MSKDNNKINEKKKGLNLSIGKKKTDEVQRISPEEKAAFVYTPELPIVNVIPNSIFERYQIKGIARKLAFSGIAIVGVLALAFAGGKALVGAENAKADAVALELSEVTSKSTALQPFQAYEIAVDSKRSALNQITSVDVNMGELYQTLLDTGAATDISLDEIAVVQYEDSFGDNNNCTNPDPFQTATNTEIIVGCVTLEGGSNNQESVQAFLNGLEQVGDTPGQFYRDAFISSFTSTDSGSATAPHLWEANVAFSEAFYTGKYEELAKTLAEVLTNGADTTEGETAIEEPQEEPATEEPSETVAEPGTETTTNSTGPLAQYAGTLVPNLTTDEATNIDSMGFAFCDGAGLTADSLTTSLTGLLTDGHPEVADITTVVNDIVAFIEPNCEAILSTKENAN